MNTGNAVAGHLGARIIKLGTKLPGDKSGRNIGRTIDAELLVIFLLN